MMWPRIPIAYKCPSCFFYQEGACILNRKWPYFCPLFTRKIRGITDVKDYVGFVNARRLSERALRISACSLLISTFGLTCIGLKLFLDSSPRFKKAFEDLVDSLSSFF